MTLIKSISGIRGTIGGRVGEGLNPPDIVRFTSAYGTWMKNKFPGKKLHVVVGRDARISGDMVCRIVTGSLSGLGIDVTDCGIVSTPTVEIAVTELKADGGLILTASHNPKQWNALKLLNNLGEFLSADDGNEVLKIASDESKLEYADAEHIGKVSVNDTMTDLHIKKILTLPLVNTTAIKSCGFRVVVDAVNSVGGIAVPLLLKALGVKEVIKLNCEPDGNFAHNPEPLPEHLMEISKLVKEKKAHLGIVVDPDVDRLALVCENGAMFGEEYTLVAVADYVLQHKKGNTVSNLSSSRALRDITVKYDGIYETSAVGEVNVVIKMKEINAVIGGEGNGGVILPELHYGRDALAGIALFLSWLAVSEKSCSTLRAGYPEYYMSKNKIELKAGIDVDKILQKVQDVYKGQQINTSDGVKIDFPDEWVHLRRSNTEPVIRIYSEARSKSNADALAKRFVNEINLMI